MENERLFEDKWREYQNNSGLPLHILSLPYAEARVGECEQPIKKVFSILDYQKKRFLVNEFRHGYSTDVLKEDAERIIIKNIQESLVALRQIVN